MNSKVIIAVIIILILVIIVVAFPIRTLINSNNNGGKTNYPYTPFVSDEQWNDGYVPQISGDYLQIDKDKITNYTSMVAEAVSYKYDSQADTTYFDIYLQNRGTEAVDNNSVCNIELMNGDTVKYTIGGMIEEGEAIQVGGRTVIKTQMIGEAHNIDSARISFADLMQDNNSVDEQEVLIEDIEPTESEEVNSSETLEVDSFGDEVNY